MIKINLVINYVVNQIFKRNDGSYELCGLANELLTEIAKKTKCKIELMELNLFDQQTGQRTPYLLGVKNYLYQNVRPKVVYKKNLFNFWFDLEK